MRLWKASFEDYHFKGCMVGQKCTTEVTKVKATSKNVIPAKAGIQNPLTSLDSRLRGSDKLIIIRGSLKYDGRTDIRVYDSRRLFLPPNRRSTMLS